MQILVVCTGNTCRSPMAAGLLRTIGKEIGRDLLVRSAGLSHQPNRRVADSAIAVMEEIGIDISDDYSKPVTDELLRWADLVLTVQASHAADLREDYPWVGTKLRVLERDVRDPFGRP